MTEPDRVRTIPETAELLSISRRTLERLIADRQIAVTRFSARRVGILDSDRRAYLESIRQPAAARPSAR
jgi:excisionase family DNA binding protein